MNWTQIIMAGFATLGFAALYNLPKRRWPIAALGGAMGWAVYLLSTEIGGAGEFAGIFVGATAVAILSEILARILRTPTVLLMVPMLIPLVPGSDLYYMMSYMVTSQHELISSALGQTAGKFGAMAFAVIVVSSLTKVLTEIWQRLKRSRVAS